MNKKSWLVVIAAALLLFFGAQGASLRQERSNLNAQLAEEMMGNKTIEEGSSSKRIAVLTVEGTIMDHGEGSPLKEPFTYDHKGTLRAIEDLKKDNNVKGLILEVNSPGGGTFESVELYRALRSLKEEKKIPIYVSMKKMAASGGYMISMAGDKIFADTETMTGSIGVIASAYNVKDLMDKYGVKVETFKTGDHKDMLSPYRSVTDEERNMMKDILNDSYQEFLKIVEEGRHMKEDDVKPLADGRIYSARQAKDKHLIDELGYRKDAIAALKKDYNLEGAKVYQVKPSQVNRLVHFFKRFSLGISLQKLMRGNGLSDDLQAVQTLSKQLGSPRPYYLYGGE